MLVRRRRGGYPCDITPTQFGWVHHGSTRARLVLKAAGVKFALLSHRDLLCFGLPGFHRAIENMLCYIVRRR